MLDYVKYRNAWICNFDPDFEQKLSDSQCKSLLKHGGWMVRNTFDFDCKEETDFWYVIKDSFGGLDELSKKDRKSVIKALDSFDYQIVNKKFIEDNGYEIAKKAFDAYAIHNVRMTKKVFYDFLQRWDENHCDFWAVFDKKDERFIGYSVVINYIKSSLYDKIFILPEYRSNQSCVFYGMYYKRNEYYLGEKKKDYVNDGSRSVTEHSNAQPFLIKKFNFRKAYCKLKIRYKWWFGIIVRVLLPFRNVIPNRNVQAVLNMHLMQS